jgi:hypothetical protein
MNRRRLMAVFHVFQAHDASAAQPTPIMLPPSSFQPSGRALYIKHAVSVAKYANPVRN